MRLTPSQSDPRQWARFLKQIRHTLDDLQFTEVTTPHVVPAGAFEGVIDTLDVHYSQGQAQLHTSPEIEMKEILRHHPMAIYQICQCFRDDPPTPIHWTEFTMLEFYRMGADYSQIINDMRHLITALSSKPLLFAEITINELFKQHAQLDLEQLDNRDQFFNTLKSAKLTNPQPQDSWEDLFFKVMLDCIEPKLEPHTATIVKDYPVRIAALAKVRGHYAEKFEIYWHGMELCNGCSELTDVGELKKRIEFEANIRRERNLPPHPYPQRLVDILKEGLDECAGVAVGLNRLFQCIELAS